MCQSEEATALQLPFRLRKLRHVQFPRTVLMRSTECELKALSDRSRRSN